MRSSLIAVALFALALSMTPRAFAENATATPGVLPETAASPLPLPTPNLHPYEHPAFATYAARDPGLVPDVHASTMSGLRAYATIDGPQISGYLEPSEGVVGSCGKKYYAAVPLDSGSIAGFSGWLIYGPSGRRHLAVIPGTEGLEFHGDRIRASSFVYNAKHDGTAAVHRVDSWACRASTFRLIESHVSATP